MINLQKKTILNRQFILERLSEYDIFRMYYPYEFQLNKPCLSPFKDEDNPSFIIGNKWGDGLTFKAFNSPNHGDCFHFVMQRYGLDYNEALNRIASDFGLIDGTDSYKEIITKYETPVGIKKHPTFIQARPRQWSYQDVMYLADYKLEPKDLQFCPDTRCYSTKEWAINRQRQPLLRGEVCFFYNLVNERGSWIKVYRPHAPKDLKWRSSVPFTEIMGRDNLDGCELGIITKSIKDGAVIAKYITKNVCVTQAEDFTAITKENIDFFNQSCRRIVVAYDSDAKGVEACTEITKETGWGYINPPKHLLIDGITDFSDYIKATNPETVREFFKSKNVIK